MSYVLLSDYLAVHTGKLVHRTKHFCSLTCFDTFIKTAIDYYYNYHHKQYSKNDNLCYN